ncbi:hypothetical protein PR048_012784 [Dryococelus australis]|uniref:Uncharacterized protein n=1 Tax=Dryococelus australis TaxID=614101 RepID=A0ABQ9HQE6_9NEOP|nr:hypothetical protein PR048_012784 [Dryococelus australis]
MFCKLFIFVKTVDEQFSIKEKLLDLVPLPISANGSDIYSALVSVVEKYGRFSKCSCIVTEGAKCMTGKNTGLVGLLRKNYDLPVLHCITHHKVLCNKFVKMNDVMKKVILVEISPKFHDISLRSEIRWLSAGKLLTAFFEFLETAGKIEYDYLEKHQNEECLSTLAFLTDITEHLNIFKLKLKGKKQNICQLMSHIEAFKKKLRIFKEDLKSELKFFKSSSEIKNKFNSTDLKQYGQYVIELRKESEKLFSDFDNMKTMFHLFADPMAVTIEDQDPELEMELCELQSDILLSSKQNLT